VLPIFLQLAKGWDARRTGLMLFIRPLVGTFTSIAFSRSTLTQKQVDFWARPSERLSLNFGDHSVFSGNHQRFPCVPNNSDGAQLFGRTQAESRLPRIMAASCLLTIAAYSLLAWAAENTEGTPLAVAIFLVLVMHRARPSPITLSLAPGDALVRVLIY
jgi:hypothetical protein